MEPGCRSIFKTCEHGRREECLEMCGLRGQNNPEPARSPPKKGVKRAARQKTNTDFGLKTLSPPLRMQERQASSPITMGMTPMADLVSGVFAWSDPSQNGPFSRDSIRRLDV